MRLFSFFVLALCLVVSSCATKKRPILKSPFAGIVKETGTKTTSSSARTSTSGLNYIETYKDIAIREMNKYGIPASIKLAQALLESGNGNSYLAKEANNHFGIKCGGVWNGKSVARDDDNPNDCFRVYNSVEESYRDHSQFLLRKRYEKLFALRKDDYKGWAKGLKEAGYATNPRYPDLLIDLIERYNLHQYDRKESFQEQHQREDKVIQIIENKAIQEPVREAQIKESVAMIIHEVTTSQTLYGISRQYNVSVDQIKLLNNLTSDNLFVGQLLMISK